MTVNSKKITAGPYAGNGVATAFSYGFGIENKTELAVYETDPAGVVTILTVDTDYTVSGVGVPAGGLVTRVAGALPSGYTWDIISNFEETQLTAFTSQGPFFPEIHEKAMDKLTRLIQQMLDGLSRTISFPFPNGNFNARGKRITNLGSYIASTDAVNAEDVGRIISDVNGGILNHNLTTNRNEPGAHDAIYERQATVAEIENGDFDVVGTILRVVDRAWQPYEIKASGSPDGKGVLNAGGGKVAEIISEVQTRKDSQRYGFKNDPSQLRGVNLLGTLSWNESIQGTLQGFDYDDTSNRCFISGYLSTGLAYPENEQIWVAELACDHTGAPLSITHKINNLGNGHGEALLVDVKPNGNTFIWISHYGTLAGNDSSIRCHAWPSGTLVAEYPYVPSLFSWADHQGGAVLISGGDNYYVSYDDFTAGNFTPFYTETRAAIVSRQIMSSGQQALKRRFGTDYGLTGFNMTVVEDFNSCYLTADDVTLNLYFDPANIGVGLATFIEPEGLGFKVDNTGVCRAVVAAKSADTLYFFSCSGNGTSIQQDNKIGNGRFRLGPTSNLVSYNQQYTEVIGPFAAKGIGIGSGIITGNVNNYDNYFLYTKYDGADRQEATGVYFKGIEWGAMGQLHSITDWTSPSYGFRTTILNAPDRGRLGKYPIQISKNNLFVGVESFSNQFPKYSAVFRGDTTGVSAYSYNSLVGYLSAASVLALGTTGTSLFIGGYNSVTDVATQWTLIQADRIRPTANGAQRLGESAIRFSDIFLINNPTVGSDARIKTDIASIPQNLLDFALGVEFKQYKMKDGTRTHYGIIIDNEFLSSLSQIVDTNLCAAFCYDVFADEDGNPIDVEMHGVTLGDIWHVRYAEWHCIVLEAMRRKLLSM